MGSNVYRLPYIVSLEERGLIEVFGEDYREYRRYVPALLPHKGAGGQRYREHLLADTDVEGPDPYHE
jgi:hypothetical protein